MPSVEEDKEELPPCTGDKLAQTLWKTEWIFFEAGQ